MGTEVYPKAIIVKILIIILILSAIGIISYKQIQNHIDNQLATVQAELDISRKQTDDAIKRANEYRAKADATDQELLAVKKEQEMKRAELLAELQKKNLELVNLKTEAERIAAEYEAKLDEFNKLTPSEVAENIQNTLQAINPASTFSLTEANLFIANEPAARTIGISLQERSKFNSLYSNCLIENTVLNEEIATMRGMVDSYATELSHTQESADQWKQSSLAEKAARQQAENQIQKQDAVIKQLNRKLWWKKIEGPIYGVGGGIAGYLIAKTAEQK